METPSFLFPEFFLSTRATAVAQDIDAGEIAVALVCEGSNCKSEFFRLAHPFFTGKTNQVSTVFFFCLAHTGRNEPRT